MKEFAKLLNRKRTIKENIANVVGLFIAIFFVEFVWLLSTDKIVNCTYCFKNRYDFLVSCGYLYLSILVNHNILNYFIIYFKNIILVSYRVARV